MKNRHVLDVLSETSESSEELTEVMTVSHLQGFPFTVPWKHLHIQSVTSVGFDLDSSESGIQESSFVWRMTPRRGRTLSAAAVSPHHQSLLGQGEERPRLSEGSPGTGTDKHKTFSSPPLNSTQQNSKPSGACSNGFCLSLEAGKG